VRQIPNVGTIATLIDEYVVPADPIVRATVSTLMAVNARPEMEMQWQRAIRS
jgi:hypothetical protein